MFTLDFGTFSPSGKTLALAVSGGRDSMAMLQWFWERRGKYRFFVVNVEHGLRGETSLRDSAFVRARCEELGVRFYPVAVDVRGQQQISGGTTEEVARELRYAAFEELLKSGEADAVVLAHNRDDQVETLLLRLFRGTGLRGLCGMPVVRDDKYVRPMLSVSRADINEFVLDRGVKYVEDETNADEKYARNFIRRTVMPLLSTRYDDVGGSILRLSRHAEEAMALVASLAPVPVPTENSCTFDVADLASPLPAKYALSRALFDLGAQKDVEEVHLNSLLVLAAGENGKRLDLPFGLVAYKEYDKLTLARAGEYAVSGETPFEDSTFGETFLSSMGTVRFYRGEKGGRPPYELKFDAEKVPATAVLRGRREGDRFCKFGGGGTVSLSDYLIDKKIPSRLRDGLLLLADGDEVLLIAGVEISERVRVDGDSSLVASVRVV